jgi:hypothetical protein
MLVSSLLSLNLMLLAWCPLVRWSHDQGSLSIPRSNSVRDVVRAQACNDVESLDWDFLYHLSTLKPGIYLEECGLDPKFAAKKVHSPEIRHWTLRKDFLS